MVNLQFSQRQPFSPIPVLSKLLYQKGLFLVGLVMFFNSMNLDTNMVVATLGQDPHSIVISIFRSSFVCHVSVVKQCSIEETHYTFAIPV